jgi:aspartate kinase
VALAAALSADACEIYSDVDGVFTADPRVVPRARKLSVVTSEEMLELSANGAKVLYIRAVEYARRHGVLIHARSTFSSGVGTYVLGPGMNLPDGEEGAEMEEPIVAGVATDLSQAKITVIGVPDVPGKAAEIFKVVAKSGANVDMIVQNVSAATTGRTDISFTLPKTDAATALKALAADQSEVGFESLVHDDQIGKLSVVGAGMRTHSGVSATLFEALSVSGINIEMISTSEIRISVVVRGDDLAEAARVVHTAYGLDGDADAVVHAGTGR